MGMGLGQSVVIYPITEHFALRSEKASKNIPIRKNRLQPALSPLSLSFRTSGSFFRAVDLQFFPALLPDLFTPLAVGCASRVCLEACSYIDEQEKRASADSFGVGRRWCPVFLWHSGCDTQ